MCIPDSLVAYTTSTTQGAGGREGGKGGRGGRRKFYLRAELIKCIDPNEGEALKRGREGGEGRSRGAAENFTWGAELIKCIDPNEGEALRRGAVERGGRGRDGWKGGEGQGRRGGRKFYLGGAGFPAGFHLLGGGGS